MNTRLVTARRSIVITYMIMSLFLLLFGVVVSAVLAIVDASALTTIILASNTTEADKITYTMSAAALTKSSIILYAIMIPVAAYTGITILTIVSVLVRRFDENWDKMAATVLKRVSIASLAAGLVLVMTALSVLIDYVVAINVAGEHAVGYSGDFVGNLITQGTIIAFGLIVIGFLARSVPISAR